NIARHAFGAKSNKRRWNAGLAVQILLVGQHSHTMGRARFRLMEHSVGDLQFSMSLSAVCQAFERLHHEGSETCARPHKDSRWNSSVRAILTTQSVKSRKEKKDIELQDTVESDLGGGSRFQRRCRRGF
uniref:PID domain-containing protein n=1 Tax=Macrostomum lignano TaxID=282301 RepID=A0A1I8F887_9PLAT